MTRCEKTSSWHGSKYNTYPIPILCKLKVQQLTFVINRQHRAYTGKISKETIINSIATASGELGSCADYLMQTVNGLMKVGIKDQQLLWLSKQVSARLD
ncbi:gamma-glutamylcyclotransferase [Nostoc sp. FACHB-888]|uniref:gamma-glutamylcyclotransferase n=1 Tax=Nostoc sp. FACHB-888 TaxID=2692842 RepID=UPI001F55377C|nr:gamma-glutamylcyclotransferase [Nostoc sp. FACHB-888]